MQSHTFDSETILVPPTGASAPTQRAWAAEALERGLARVIAYLTQQQRTADHWVGTLSSSALATAMSIVALKLVDETQYAERIRRGRRWLIRTQAQDGGWGDAVVDASNINATSLALSALAFTATEQRDAAEDHTLTRGHQRLDQFGGWATVGDPHQCTLSGPCRTVAALAGLMEWRRIKRLRPEVVLLPTRVRRTISTTFPAYLSISLLHTAKVRHPLNYLPTYARARRQAITWLGRAQGANGSFEESAFLTSVILMGLIASGHRHLSWLQSAVKFVVESQRQDGGWPIDRDLETFDTD
ncbi:MAG: hypothetical protein IVW57_00715, partial [Ktedonobacterales bacterium]|nr:hypothetical protein [Ktedonobacterales bacterium]